MTKLFTFLQHAISGFGTRVQREAFLELLAKRDTHTFVVYWRLCTPLQRVVFSNETRSFYYLRQARVVCKTLNVEPQRPELK